MESDTLLFRHPAEGIPPCATIAAPTFPDPTLKGRRPTTRGKQHSQYGHDSENPQGPSENVTSPERMHLRDVFGRATAASQLGELGRAANGSPQRINEC